MRTSSTLAALAALTCALAGCGLQRYEARPLDPAAIQARILARSPHDESIRDALARGGVDTAQWPLARWNLRALTLLAFERNPELAAARAEVEVARARTQSATTRANPGIELAAEHHSRRADNGSPWTFGVALDLPLTNASRRAARVGIANAEEDAATWQAAARAWQVRHDVREAAAALAFAREERANLEKLQEKVAIKQILTESRLKHGAADASAVALVRGQHAAAAQALAAARSRELDAQAALARATGLTPDALAAFDLDLAALAAEPRTPDAAALQTAALNDRLDVRAALARYAAADAALQLEVARQVPEFRLRPGYSWDQGDIRWSLGLGFALQLFDRNQGPLAEAGAKREAEAARFEALQSAAINELAAARAAEAGAREELARSRAQAAEAARFTQRTERRLSAGDADRHDVLAAQIAELETARATLAAQRALWRQYARLEDAVQRPLDELPAPPEPARAARAATP